LRAGWGLTWLVLVQIASVSIAIVLAVLTIQRIATKVSYSLDWQVLRKHIVDATPFAGVLVALYLNHQISIVLLSAFAAKEEVGYFAAALRLYDNFSLIPTAIMGAFLPTMSRLYGTSVSVFVRVLRFTLKYLFILSAPIVVGTALVAPSIVLFLYGESFAPSSPALQVLNSALLFDFWNFAIDTLLIARNRDWLLFKVTWVSAVIFVSANLVLIPLFSYRGACWAILMTQALRFLILSPFLRRYLSVRVLLQLILLPTLCAAIMGSIVFTIRNWNLWVIILVGIVSYGGALFISGAVHRRDIEGLQMKIPGHPASSFLEA